MEAIILAGGLGTRLSSVVNDVPKSMVLIGDKPCLQYLIDHAIDFGADKIILAVGHKVEHIIDYFGNSYRGIKIKYSYEKELLGTGGAIKKAFDLVYGNRAFVFNGDISFNVNLVDMQESHFKNEADITIATKRLQNFNRYGSIASTYNRVIAFNEKRPMEDGYINGGVYLIEKKYFEKFLDDKFSIEKDVFEKHCLSDRFYAFESDSYFIDIGIPEDYEKVKNGFPV